MTCCTTVREIIDEAYVLLGDPERERWTVDQLVGFINEALCEILTYRPDEFTDVVELTLQPGRLQRLPREYRQFVSLEHNAGDDYPLQEVPEDLLRAFSRKRCVPRRSACYRVTSWSRNAANKKTFYVDPPVPDGMNPVVVATVVLPPPVHHPDKLDECIGLDCAYRAQIVDWVMMRALEVDQESERQLAMSETYRRKFYTALGVDYVQESRFNSGNWLGRTSEGEAAPQTTSAPRS